MEPPPFEWQWPAAVALNVDGDSSAIDARLLDFRVMYSSRSNGWPEARAIVRRPHELGMA